MKRQSMDDERSDRDGLRGHLPDEDDASTTLVNLSPYYGHLDCFSGICPLVVKTNRFTYAPSYPPNDQIQNTWLSIALEGIGALFSYCAPRAAFRQVAVIGTGNGLDVVGISRIVRPPEIVASDIHPGVIQAARWNIAHYVAEECKVTVRQSDLFTDYPAGEAFDLIYENLPNIPDGTDLFEGIRSASCYAPRAHGVRSACDRYLLTLHHDFLVQARSRLHDSGWVVCLIGGRFPVRVIHRMFRTAGYRSMVVGFGLKIQSEADVVLPAYAAVERENGSSFAYYHPLEKCISISRELSQPTDLLSRGGYARRLTERLRNCRVSATEAARLHHDGDSVCHTVYVIAGSMMPKERSDG